MTPSRPGRTNHSSLRYIASPDDVTNEGGSASARLLGSRDGKVQAVAIISELYDY